MKLSYLKRLSRTVEMDIYTSKIEQKIEKKLQNIMKSMNRFSMILVKNIVKNLRRFERFIKSLKIICLKLVTVVERSI